MADQIPTGKVFPISSSVFRVPKINENPTHYFYDGVYWDALDWNRVKNGLGGNEEAKPFVILTLKEIWDNNPGYETIFTGSGWFIFDDLGHRIARVDGITVVG